MAPRTRSSAAKGQLRHGLIDDDEIEELWQQPTVNIHMESPQQQDEMQGMFTRARISMQVGERNDGLHHSPNSEELEHQQNEQPLHQQIEIQPDLRNAEQLGKKGKARGVRGPTMLSKMWVTIPGEERIKLHINGKGQPIGPNKRTFVEFLGTIARNPKFTPLEINDWRKISELTKKQMIDLVKTKYDIPPGFEHWILKSLAKKRRSWKNRVKTECFDPKLPVEENLLKTPMRVEEEQWKQLLPYWAKEKTRVLAERNKEIRKNLRTQPTTGKKSFAEIEEDTVNIHDYLDPCGEVFEEPENGHHNVVEKEAADRKSVRANIHGEGIARRNGTKQTYYHNVVEKKAAAEKSVQENIQGEGIATRNDTKQTYNHNVAEKEAAAEKSVQANIRGEGTATRNDTKQAYNMIVKATYRDDAVKFNLCSDSRFEDLLKALNGRFELGSKRVKIKYEDKEDGDWIMIAGDEDLRFHMDSLISTGQTRMTLKLFPLSE